MRSADHFTICCSGFKEQIYDVYRYLPPATQVVLISATLPHEILEMTNKFMTDPIRILVKRLVCHIHDAAYCYCSLRLGKEEQNQPFTTLLKFPGSVHSAHLESAGKFPERLSIFIR